MKQKWLIAAVFALLVAGVVGYYALKPADPSGLTAKKAGQQEFLCPMHPFITSNNPGTCPICAMDLIRKFTGEGIPEKELSELSHVALSPTQQIMANLKTAVVEVKPFTKEITATGIVTFDQEKQGKVTTLVAGRIERLHVRAVGACVNRNRPVAEVSSLELINTQEEYLVAHRSVQLFNASVAPIFMQNSQQSLFQSRQRLRELGFREHQFDALLKSGKPNILIPIYSPISGVVIDKLVQVGQSLKEGDALFSVADLSRVWVELEVYETDFPLIRKDQQVIITAKAYPEQLFHGRVTYIYPFLDPKTRTVKVRISLPNPGLKLKPDMFTTAVLKVPMPDSLVVPSGAVMDTGKRQLVWVQSKPDVFIPREVKTGVRSSAGVQVLAGLKAGERVAVNGAYLIDSEAQLSRGGEVSAQPVTAAEEMNELDLTGMKMPAGANVPRAK
jgi:membrane fusion protein, copper/silver efflux system